MVFEATCAAAVAKNGSVMVLLKFDAPKSGHLMGELPIDLGQLERDVLYRVTIERVEPGTISSDAG